MNSQVLPTGLASTFAQRARAFYALTKPRVVSLIVFTAVIGMLLATPGAVPLQILIGGTLGIALVAGAAAAINCLVEHGIDAVMLRTRWRPLPRGELTAVQTLVFAGVVGAAGLWALANFVNMLTMWRTWATFVGYAIVYTVILKPATPQNIVIGGAAGAMPPVLGWAAVTGNVGARDASNPRIDYIAYKVRDTDEDATGSEDDSIVVIAGTPAGSPSPPSIPATVGTVVVLSEVLVPSTANGGALPFSPFRPSPAGGVLPRAAAA